MVVLTITIVFSDPLMACKCERVPRKDPAKEWLQEFEGVVFRGRVVKTVVVKVPADNGRSGEYYLERDVTFIVEELWKGPDQKQFTIRTGMGNGDCGVGYAQGRTEFVAANRYAGRLYTGICNTVKLDMKTIGDLGKGRVPR